MQVGCGAEGQAIVGFGQLLVEDEGTIGRVAVKYHDGRGPVIASQRLPMDPRTRDFVKINGRSYLREPLDEQWILERWPADLSAASRAA